MPLRREPKIYFFFNKRKFYFRNRTALKLFIEGIFKHNGKRIEGLNFIFCSDKDILKINSKYLNHKYLTDIITFDLSGAKNLILADVYISDNRVRRNAKKLGLSFSQELHRVIFHGVLHLCGYNDKTEKQTKKMREMEDYYLSLYFNRHVSRDTVSI
jgi:probable rRNA maturation factor